MPEEACKKVFLGLHLGVRVDGLGFGVWGLGCWGHGVLLWV